MINYKELMNKNPDYSTIFKIGMERGRELALQEVAENKLHNPMKIKVQLDEGAFMPVRAHKEDAGWDLRTPVNIDIDADGFAEIDTGVHVEIPVGYVGMVKSKSGLNVKHGITTEGVIDAGYTGSVRVKMYCKNKYGKIFTRGDKITQLVIMPIPFTEMVQVDEIRGCERGDAGFGSTGV